MREGAGEKVNTYSGSALPNNALPLEVAALGISVHHEINRPLGSYPSRARRRSGPKGLLQLLSQIADSLDAGANLSLD